MIKSENIGIISLISFLSSAFLMTYHLNGTISELIEGSNVEIIFLRGDSVGVENMAEQNILRKPNRAIGAKNSDVGAYMANIRHQANIDEGKNYGTDLFKPIQSTFNPKNYASLDLPSYKETTQPTTLDHITKLSISEKQKLNLTMTKTKKSSIPMLDNYGNCTSMLNFGYWKSQNLNHTFCSSNESCRENAWKPVNCQWKKYSSEDALQCFKNRKILFIGDSRGRQAFRSMENRLEGNLYLNDQVEHHDIFKKIIFNQGKDHVSIRWLWITKLTDHFNTAGILEQLFLDLLRIKDLSKIPSLIVFNSLLLHPTRICHSIELCNRNYKGFKYIVEFKFLPIFRQFIKKKVTIVWLGSEALSDRHSFSHSQNLVLKDQNFWLRKLFYTNFSEDERKLIAFIGATAKTVWSWKNYSGDLLLSDGTRVHHVLFQSCSEHAHGTCACVCSVQGSDFSYTCVCIHTIFRFFV